MSRTYCRYLLVVLLLCLICNVPVIAATWEEYWAPWVTKTTTTRATINWRGESDGLGLIDYATSDYYNEHHSFETTVASMNIGRYQHINLTGLEPDTSYTYRVRPSGDADEFGNRTFRTMLESGPFTFIVISDPQKGHNYDESQRFRYVADAIAREPDVLFILCGGDYNGKDSAEDMAEFFHVARGMLANTTLFPCIGNHEYHDPVDSSNPPTNATHYHWAFEMPLNYSFDCAGVRFVVLNSPDPDNAQLDDPHPSKNLTLSQEPWLREQLDNDLLGTFTLQHHPIWDWGRTGMNPNLSSWETLYHTYNISANFAGHTHSYQRFNVEGIPYFIVGNAGGRFNDIPDIKPACYVNGLTRRLGYLKVTVDPAHNTATAQEILVAHVFENDSGETPHVYTTPIIEETITFPLKPDISVFPVAGMRGSVSSGPDYGPAYVPGIRVRVAQSEGGLTIPGQFWEAATDDWGIYALTGLPSGVTLYATALSPANQPDSYYMRPIQYQVNAGPLVTCTNQTCTPLIPPLVAGTKAQVNWVLTQNPGKQVFFF